LFHVLNRLLFKMLDPLTCLSIACSVMQIISFSHEVTSIVKRIKKDGTADPELREHADNLSKSSDGLEQYLKSCDLKHLPKNQAELREIASKCLETSKDIQSKMDKIDSSRGGLVLRALKLKWRKGDFEKLEQDMGKHQDTMQTHILVHLW
jgi:ribosome-binding ATPase YchF (GTP1/OBG family)